MSDASDAEIIEQAEYLERRDALAHGTVPPTEDERAEAIAHRDEVRSANASERASASAERLVAEGDAADLAHQLASVTPSEGTMPADPGSLHLIREAEEARFARELDEWAAALDELE